MAILTRSDFDNWRSDPVTKAFMEAAHIRIEDAKNVLSEQAGIDSSEDAVIRGMIRAYREMQDFRIDDLED